MVDEPSYPALSPSSRSAPRGDQDTVDLDKTRPAQLLSPAELDPKDYPQSDGRPPISDRAKYLFKLGKSYLTFYKTGFSSVWYNYKQSSAIRKRLAPSVLDEAAKYGGQSRAGRRIPIVTQAEYQFCLRTRHDIFKLIPFSLVFAICGEFTPLVILALGTVVVPYTCRIPKQEFKDLKKKLQREKQYMEDMAKIEGYTQDGAASKAIPEWQREWYEAYRYNLTFFRHPIPVLGSVYHKSIIRPRLIRHCESLLCNTILIQREGGFRNLTPRSIFEWADKYSLHALHKYLDSRIITPPLTLTPQRPGQIQSAQQQTSPPPPANQIREQSLSITELCTDDPKFKTSLVAACDEEAKFILDRVVLDWTRLKPECHWRTTFQAFTSDSPDSVRRRKDIETLTRTQESTVPKSR